MRIVAALAIGAATVLAAPAAAQDQGDLSLEEIIHTELAPETQAIASELTRLSGTPRLFDEILPQIADEAKSGFIRANPQMQLGIITVVDRVAVSLVSRRPELDSYLARIWAAAFSDEEMQDLIDFYSSETGQKFSRALPQVLAVQTAAAQNWAQSVGAELALRVREELEAALATEQRALTGEPLAQPPTGDVAQ